VTPTNKETFLRGNQPTDKASAATLQTISRIPPTPQTASTRMAERNPLLKLTPSGKGYIGAITLAVKG